MKHKGFTLIELLVVVLIIGILAAVAIPQYQKAVEKAKATQLLAILTPIANAMEAYQMANGSFFSSFDDLDISLSQDQKNKFLCDNISTCNNQEYSIARYEASNNLRGIVAIRNSGTYRGAGFAIFSELGRENAAIQTNTLYCYERAARNDVTDFQLSRGSFCTKFYNGVWIPSFQANASLFSLP